MQCSFVIVAIQIKFGLHICVLLLDYALKIFLEYYFFPSGGFVNSARKGRLCIQQILSTCQIRYFSMEHSEKNGKCRKGTCQGSPWSPYLFILVANVLNKMLNNVVADSVFEHPILLGAPCLAFGMPMIL